MRRGQRTFRPDNQEEDILVTMCVLNCKWPNKKATVKESTPGTDVRCVCDS